MSTYEERKAERRKAYAQKLGMRSVPCSACSGSGRYDNHGSPACGACDGTGKESVPRVPVMVHTPVPHWRDGLKHRNSLVAARRSVSA